MTNSYYRSAEELEMRVQERTAELEKANQALHAEILERERVEKELIRTKNKLESEIRDTKILSKLSTLRIEDGDSSSIFQEIIEAAIAIIGADKGNIQILDPSEGKLRIAAQKGFDLPFLESIKTIDVTETAPYKNAVERMGSVVVSDITQSSIFVGNDYLSMLLNEGIRAFLLTPLFSRSGKPLGVVSTYFSNIYTPAEHELIFVDILARLAADIIDNGLIKEELRENCEELDHTQAVGNIGSWRLNLHKNEIVWSDENYNIFGIPKGIPLTYETFLSAVHPDDREYVIQKWEERLAGEPYDIEHRIIAEGRIKWVREKAILEFDKNGKLLGGFGIIQDITKSKRVEEALCQREQSVKQKLETVLSPTGEIANLKLSEIVDTHAIQSLMDDFYKLAHIPMSLDDLRGNILVGIGWQDICTKFHRMNPETCKHCVESDTKISAGVNSGEFKLYKCKNNMWDIATPIIVGGHHVGNIFSGQFFFDDEPLNYELFRSQARRYGFNEEEYIAALEKVPRLSREAVDTGMSFFMKLASMISQLSYSNIKLAQSLAERDSVVEALEESEEKYRIVADNTFDWEFWLGPDGRFLYISPSCERVTGYAAREFMNNPDLLKEIIHPDDLHIFLQHRNIIPPSRHGDIEFRILTKEGEIRWIHHLCQPLYDGEGHYAGSRGSNRDITERKRAEELLAFERSQLLSIFDGIDDAVYVTDPYTYEVLYANKAMKEKFGGELMGGICYREFQQRDSPCEFCTNQIILKERNKPYHWEYYNPTVDRYFMIMDRIIKWPDGRDVRFEIAKDITERKRAETTLKESENRFRSVLENSLDAAYRRNLQTDSYDYISPVIEQLTGFSVEEMNAMSTNEALDHMHSDDRSLVAAELARALDAGIGTFEYRFKCKDGKYLWLADYFKVIKDQNCRLLFISGVVRDITERKQAEEALRLSSLYNRSLIEASLDPLVTIGPDGKITDVNGATEQVTGYARNDLIGTDFSDYFTEPENARKGYQRVFTEGKVWDYPLEIRHKDGHTTPVLYNASVYRDENDEVIGVFAAARDITERRKAEESLRKIHDNLEKLVKKRTAELEKAYRSLKEIEKGLADAQRMAHVGNWRWDIVAGELFWSDEVYRIFGLNPQEFKITYNSFLNYVHPDDRDYLTNAIRKGLNGSPVDVEYRIVLADGEERIVHTEAESIFYEENIPVQAKGIIQDITERKKAEYELEKLNRIRIKEIHHRIKNNLQVISSLLDLQAEKFQNKECIEDSEVLKAFEESQNRVLSMSLIHEELYKGEGTDKLNFSAYVQRLAENLFQVHSINSRNVQLCLDLEDSSFFDMDTAIPLGIIVNELVSNSLKHAFNEGQEGEIRVRLCSEEENGEIQESLFSLTISDNGKGLPENVEMESLESLGLQLVNILVDQLDGKIETKRENGTEFRITFNAAERHGS